MRIIALALLLASVGTGAERLPAFPGAEGAGKWTRGGRAGRVIAVTNLDDSGPGSLRAAVDAREPRTVVFRISGTIELKSPLRIMHPFVTIAGQTAPGGGICIKGSELQIGATHEVIVRHLRVRPGDKTSKASELDAISIWDAQDVVIDHCSATWSTDECLSVTRDSDRVTVQHCLIAEALTEHSYGSIIAAHHGAISFLNNLYASNRSRNPRPSNFNDPPKLPPSPGPRIDFRNNTLYNWQSAAGYSGTDGEAGPERVAMNYVGNFLKPGPDTAPAHRSFTYILYPGGVMEMFLAGNQLESQQPLRAQTDLIWQREGSTLALRKTALATEMPRETVSASAAYAQALTGAGATKPARDAADARIIAGVRDGTGRQFLTISSDAWPDLKSTAPPADTDGDALPDAWERSHDLNPQDPADAAMTSKEGWTHLELWLNALTQDRTHS